MFTDSFVTPRRLETLIEVVRYMGNGVSRDSVFGVLQPEGLHGAEKHLVATAVLGAAAELHLVEGSDRLTATKSSRSVRQLVLEALDREVLAKMDVEPYFAALFSYLLGRGEHAASTRDAIVTDFKSRALPHPTHKIALNPTMITGINRWLSYAGLGWFDSEGVFQCCPYERLERALPTVFESDSRLSSDEFLNRLATACPELDGGSIFIHSNPDFESGLRLMTAGLSTALVELHLDKRIQLHASPDSGGWSLERTEPPNDGKTLNAARLDFIEFFGVGANAP